MFDHTNGNMVYHYSTAPVYFSRVRVDDFVLIAQNDIGDYNLGMYV